MQSLIFIFFISVPARVAKVKTPVKVLVAGEAECSSTELVQPEVGKNMATATALVVGELTALRLNLLSLVTPASS